MKKPFRFITMSKLALAAFVASPIYIPVVYTALNSKTIEVVTSRGRTAVREWNNSRAMEVITGGLQGMTIYSDTNRDGVLDDKMSFFGSKIGYLAFHKKISDEDNAFYNEALSKARSLELEAK